MNVIALSSYMAVKIIAFHDRYSAMDYQVEYHHFVVATAQIDTWKLDASVCASLDRCG